MSIKKLTEMLGKELTKEWSAEDAYNAPQREDEFTAAEMMDVTGWTYAKARWKLKEMIKAGRITRRGKMTAFYKSTTADKMPS